jgi:hypothetical protein
LEKLCAPAAEASARRKINTITHNPPKRLIPPPENHRVSIVFKKLSLVKTLARNVIINRQNPRKV